MTVELEHANITVKDADATADWLTRAFGWHIRWEGPALGGKSVHVGTDRGYIALYTPEKAREKTDPQNTTLGAMNHIGVTVDDLDAAEAAIRAVGHEPHHHADYEPGRRFYFYDTDGIEWEVASYA